MTFVQQTTLVRLRYRDNDGAESTCQVNFASSVSYDTLLSLIPSWRFRVDALSTAVCIAGDLVIRFAEKDTITAGPQSNTRRSGLFSYDTAASLFYTYHLPSIAQDFIMQSGPFPGIQIDLALPDVIAMTDAFSNGLSGTQPCDIDATDLLSVSNAYVEQF